MGACGKAVSGGQLKGPLKKLNTERTTFDQQGKENGVAVRKGGPKGKDNFHEDFG